jgi:hypothetical protein
MEISKRRRMSVREMTRGRRKPEGAMASAGYQATLAAIADGLNGAISMAGRDGYVDVIVTLRSVRYEQAMAEVPPARNKNRETEDAREGQAQGIEPAASEASQVEQ